MALAVSADVTGDRTSAALLDSNAPPASIPTEEKRPRRAHRPDIDGIRAIAVTVVVLFHVQLKWVSGGFVGVDVFFVLSGYLMVGIIYRETLDGSFSVARFYARRIRRILPALIAVLIVVWAMAQFILTPRENGPFSLSVINTLLGVSNYQFWAQTNYFSDDSHYNPLLMTWTLGVEEQFYVIILPLMMLMIGYLPRKSLFYVTLGFCLVSLVFAEYALRVSQIGPIPTRAMLSFYWLPSRCWELGIGALLTIAEVDFPGFPAIKARFREAFGAIGLALIAYAVATYRIETTPFPGLSAIAPCLGAALLLAADTSFVNRRLLSLPPMRQIGLMSYSWYLWHWPLLSLGAILIGGPLAMPVAIGVALISLGCAWLSYTYLETPLRRPLHPHGFVFRRYGAIVAALMIPCLLAVFTHGFGAIHPQPLTRIAAALDQVKSNPCLAHDGVDKPNLSPACAPDPGAQPIVALIGDSHAAALGFGLRGWAAAHGQTPWILTKSSCPTLLGYTRYFATQPGMGADCAAFNAEVVRKVAADPRIRTVLITAFWDAGTATDASWYGPTGSGGARADWKVALGGGVTEAVTRLLRSGKRVVMILDDPRPGFNPVRRAEAGYLPLRRWVGETFFGLSAESYAIAPLSEMSDSVTNGEISAISKSLGIEVIDPRGALCDDHGCRFATPSDILYVDNQHLSAAGGERVLSQVRAN